MYNIYGVYTRDNQSSHVVPGYTGTQRDCSVSRVLRCCMSNEKTITTLTRHRPHTAPAECRWRLHAPVRTHTRKATSQRNALHCRTCTSPHGMGVARCCDACVQTHVTNKCLAGRGCARPSTTTRLHLSSQISAGPFLAGPRRCGCAASCAARPRLHACALCAGDYLLQ